MGMTPEQTAALTKKRWVILIASCLINLCVGSMYAWSSLSAPMATELGVEASAMASVFSTANAVGFITMIIGGLLNDKYGPRWVMFVGGLMFGLGMFTCGFAKSVGNLTLSYGVILGLGLSLVYGCTISNTIKFFPDKRGMVGGMTTAFYGISSVIFAPVADALSNAFGARATFKILGIVFLVIICAGSFIMQKCPAGFVPTGYVAPGCHRQEGQRQDPCRDAENADLLCHAADADLRRHLRHDDHLPGQGHRHQHGECRSRHRHSVCQRAVPVQHCRPSGCRLPQRQAWAGQHPDHALVVALVGLAALLGASLTGAMALFAVGVILIGICFGTFMGVFPGFCTDQFGQKNNTVNYGIMWIGFCLAGIVGPTILTKVHNATGTYTLAFVISLCIAVAGLVLTFVYRAVAKKN